LEMVDMRRWPWCCWCTMGRVSSSSLEKDVLSLFKLELEARLQKEEKPGTGLEAQPESMLDMEFLLPLVGLLASSCGGGGRWCPTYRLSGRQGAGPRASPYMLPCSEEGQEGKDPPSLPAAPGTSLVKLSKEELKASTPGGRPDSL